MTATATLDTFKDILQRKIHSWRQKKRCLKHLQEQHDVYSAIESKLMSGQVINPAEQRIYDSNSNVDTEKMAFLQNNIKTMVTEGQLDASEKAELLETMTSNITSIEEEIKAGGSGVEKLKVKLKNAQERKTTIEKMTPIKYSLKYTDDIVTLRLSVLKLLDIEAKGRNNALTMNDLKKLEQKDDLLEGITKYENSSKNWFQSTDEFESLCNDVEKLAIKRHESSSNSKSGKSNSKSSNAAPKKPTPSASSNAWTTVGAKKPLSRNEAKNLMQSRNGFSAAFNNEDSD